MLILDKLWDGEIYPGERIIGRQQEYAKYLREAEQAENLLLAALSPEQKRLYQEAAQRKLSMADFLERDAFFAGIRLGSRLLIDLLGETQ